MDIDLIHTKIILRIKQIQACAITLYSLAGIIEDHESVSKRIVKLIDSCDVYNNQYLLNTMEYRINNDARYGEVVISGNYTGKINDLTTSVLDIITDIRTSASAGMARGAKVQLSEEREKEHTQMLAFVKSVENDVKYICDTEWGIESAQVDVARCFCGEKMEILVLTSEFYCYACKHVRPASIHYKEEDNGGAESKGKSSNYDPIAHYKKW